MRIKVDDNETCINLHTDDGFTPIKIDSEILSIFRNYAVDDYLVTSVETTESNESGWIYDVLALGYTPDPTYELIAIWDSYIAYRGEFYLGKELDVE